MRPSELLPCVIFVAAVLVGIGSAKIKGRSKSYQRDDDDHKKPGKNAPWMERLNHIVRRGGEDFATAIELFGNMTIVNVLNMGTQVPDILDSLSKGEIPAPKAKTLRVMRKINHEQFTRTRKIFSDFVDNTFVHLEDAVDLFLDGWEALNTTRISKGKGKSNPMGAIMSTILNSFISGLQNGPQSEEDE